MGYRLEKGYSFQDNISRIASEEIEKSINSLEHDGIHEAVHDIRKRLKKLRALARLVRKDLGDKNYTPINIYFRDLGRELSPFRDLTSHIETIQSLQKRYGDHIYVNFFKTIISEINSERKLMEEKLREKDFFKSYLHDKLDKAKTEYVEWPLSGNKIEIVVPGIKKVYKRGHKALAAAYKNPGPAEFHEWRKRVKYLWYHIRLLQELWPGMFKKWQSEVHILDNYLGDDHDFVILNKKLQTSPHLYKTTEQKEMLHGLIKEVNNSLREKAYHQGKLIYAEKPGDFKKRIKKYTKAGLS